MTVFRFGKSNRFRCNASARFAGRLLFTISVLWAFGAFGGSVTPVLRLRASDILPHEAAFERAAIIAQAEVLRFDATRGVEVRINRVVRGHLAVDSEWWLHDTAQFPFLNHPGTRVTIFAVDAQSGELRLVSGPTSGGLVWQDGGETIGAIHRAWDDPRGSLKSRDFRERLAAAYYLAARQQVLAEDRKRVGDTLIDALALPDAEVNQAGIDGLGALGVGIEVLAGPYHPGFRPDLKAQTAAKLKAWWHVGFAGPDSRPEARIQGTP